MKETALADSYDHHKARLKRMRIREIEQQLTLFEDNGVPETPAHTSPINNYIARSPIFSPNANIAADGKGKFYKNQVVYTDKTASVKFTGHEMNMTVQDVMLYCYKRAQGSPLVEKKSGNGQDVVEFRYLTVNLNDIVKQIGLKKGGSNYESIKNAFEVLATANIVLEFPELGFKKTFHLLGGLEQDEVSGMYKFYVPPETASLFLDEGFGYVNMQRRQLLKRQKNLAKWLQSYMVTHSKERAHHVTTEYLQQKSNHHGRLRDFRKSLAVALDELMRAGELVWYEFTDDKKSVSWKRGDSVSENALPLEESDVDEKEEEVVLEED